MKCQPSLLLYSGLTQERWNVQRKRLVVTSQNMAELVKGLETRTWALARMPNKERQGLVPQLRSWRVRWERTSFGWEGEEVQFTVKTYLQPHKGWYTSAKPWNALSAPTPRGIYYRLKEDENLDLVAVWIVLEPGPCHMLWAQMNFHLCNSWVAWSSVSML